MRPLARLVLFFALAAAPAVAAPPIERVKLPPGFEITVFAEDVRGARSMAPGSKGWLFVSTRDAGNVYAVRHDGRKALATYTIARGLNMPNGVALKDGHLYVAEVDKVWRYDNIEEKLASGTGGLTPMPKPTLFFEGFPSDRHHGWKFIRFGPDGWLYVPVGAPCNVCEKDEGRYANIQRIRPYGSGAEVVARGGRNTVGRPSSGLDGSPPWWPRRCARVPPRRLHQRPLHQRPLHRHLHLHRHPPHRWRSPPRRPLRPQPLLRPSRGPPAKCWPRCSACVPVLNRAATFTSAWPP